MATEQMHRMLGPTYHSRLHPLTPLMLLKHVAQALGTLTVPPSARKGRCVRPHLRQDWTPSGTETVKKFTNSRERQTGMKIQNKTNVSFLIIPEGASVRKGGDQFLHKEMISGSKKLALNLAIRFALAMLNSTAVELFWCIRLHSDTGQET